MLFFCCPKGGFTIAIYHCSIKIISRGKGKSAVAAAAYRSGEKLINNYDGITHDYTRKRGIAHTEILLPSHAPPDFQNRSALWNSVEKIEKSKNSQLAREIELAIPKELPPEQQIELVREYVKDNFVSAGMCADIAIHDKNDGNPHAHIMLTMRPLNENGEWGAKSKKEYITDKNGERIKLKNGNFKTKKVDTVDWNEQSKAELWRSKWAELANKYLEQNSIADRIDHRSFERQGTEQIPTIHLGVAASQMERKGITTERGNINREIKAHNRILAEIKAKIASLKNWLADIFKRREKQPPEQNLIEILQELSKPQKINMQYRIYNPKKLAEQIQYLQDNKIFTIPQLDETVNSVCDEYDNIRITLKEVEGRLKSLAELVKQAEIYRRHRELYKQYHSLSGNKADMFRIKNYTEIALYEAAEKYLKENVNGNTLEVGKWKTDIATLTEQKNKLYSEMYKKRDELKIAESIQKSVDNALNRHTRKQNIEYER